MADHTTVLDTDLIGDLGPVTLRHPPGTFALTPASLVALEALDRQRHLLRGTGIDWGCGVGGMAIVAARVPGVERVIGLDHSAADVRTAMANAALNGVQDRVRFIHSDSFAPMDARDGPVVEGLAGAVDFLLANPPAATHGDGFDFRRRVLTEVRPFLKAGATALIQISSQYGEARIQGLEDHAPGFRCTGVVASTDWVPFDLARPDLLACLRLYAAEESRGGEQYGFRDDSGQGMDARAALARHEREGASPRSRWQVHRFDYVRG